VAGVFRDFPENSTLYDSKYFLPWKKYITTEQWVKDAATDWNNRFLAMLAEVAGNMDMDKETEKIKNVVMAHKNKADGVEMAYLYPMDKWHLYSEFKEWQTHRGCHTICMVVFYHRRICAAACVH